MNIRPYDIGVVVGRFQVDELHQGHVELIKNLINKHDKALICIGVTEVLGSKENPLDYAARSAMIRSAFPNVLTVPLKDSASDEYWSDNLDNTIKAIFPIGKVCIYGGRDSFIKHYRGHYDTYEFPSINYRPGTDIRRDIGKAVHNTPDFRKGVIYSSQNVYPRVFITVDIAILKEIVLPNNKGNINFVLLGRKSDQKDWRFPGGFVDQKESLEQSAIREVFEETNAVINEVEFIGSFPIQDWRYTNTSDSVTTVFFCGKYIEGEIKACDDLAEVGWFPVNEKVLDSMRDEHKKLMQILIEKKGRK